MNFTIIDTQHRFLELRPNPDNNSVGVVSKRRKGINDQWDTTVSILNREEALITCRALYDIFFVPQKLYPFLRPE